MDVDDYGLNLFRGSVLVFVTVAYSALFVVAIRLLSWKFARANLSSFAVYDMANRIVSGVHGVCCGAVGLAAVRTTGPDFMGDTCPFLVDALYAFSGYFIYDLVAMFLAHRRKSDLIGQSIGMQLRLFLRDQTLLVVHHFALPFVCLPLFRLLYRGRGDLFFAVFLVQELSTPFVNMRTILRHCHMTSTWLYFANNMFVVASFFVFRVLALPYVYSRYQQFAGIPHLWQVPFALPWYCNLGSAVVFAPQFYWFGQICQKLSNFPTDKEPDKDR